MLGKPVTALREIPAAVDYADERSDLWNRTLFSLSQEEGNRKSRIERAAV